MLGIKRLELLQGHRRNVRMTDGPASSKAPFGVAVPRTMMPHMVSVEERRRPAFWNPTPHYQRAEFLVEPPLLPGTAIPWTLFHPTYIPGLQGYKEYLPWNFGWAWGRNNFERFGALVARLQSEAANAQSTFRRSATWKPGMAAQPFGNGRVWMQPRPDYTPLIRNPPPGEGGGRHRRR